VWVHRLVKTRPRPPSTIHARVPARIWHNAVAVAEEVERLDAIRPVDVVLGVMWDVETIAVRERTAIPVVTTLVTTLGITLRTRPEWATDPAFMADFGEPMLALERWLMERSDAVHAISDAILTEASEVGAAVVDPARATVAPLGVVDHLGPPAPPPEGDPTVLFVGRFEKRKGIDLLLGAIPQVLATHPSVRFVLLGAHDLPGEHGESYRDVFLREHAGAPWMDRVEMPGIVDDDELWDAYRRCDVFVAPSRFESFGLVYVEAMMAGRPVVALDAGAAPEVVVAGATGELVEADADALAAAISALLADPALRHRMGAAGRRRFEEHYSAAAMAERVERLLVDVVAGVRV
jgi:glycogen synthase